MTMGIQWVALQNLLRGKQGPVYSSILIVDFKICFLPYLAPDWQSIVYQSSF